MLKSIDLIMVAYSVRVHLISRLVWFFWFFWLFVIVGLETMFGKSKKILRKTVQNFISRLF